MRSILTLAAGFSVLAAALVLGAGACSDDTAVNPVPVDASTSSDATSTLPTPVTPDASEAGPIGCGPTTCQPADFRGVATLSPCCTADGGCGLDLTAASSFIPVGQGCFPLAAPGVADDACPDYPGDGVTALALQGCCMPDHTCGVFAQVASGVDLGCVPTAGFAADAAPATTCGYHDASTD